MSSAEGQGASALPELRPELRLVPGAPNATGARTWLIEDPVRHRFVQIDAAAYDLLALLPGCRTAADLIAAARQHCGLELTDADIERLVHLLYSQELTVEPPQGGWRSLSRRADKAQGPSFNKFLHNYLFFRVPLWRPQRFLTRTLPLIAPLISRTFAAVTLLAAILGLYLVSREWDAFTHTFGHFFTWQGAAGLAIAMGVVKILHELGHAYSAVRYGCSVPTIGVAFMMLAPMPYTDVTDTWRLRDRRQRLAVDSAGIAVELIVAAYATLAWAFLPEGPIKSVAFVLATVGWIMSLAINLNPFMRFDGYYIACELTGLENLQPRSFAVGKWLIREVLFRLGDPCPERFSRRTVAAMAIYAYAVWIYRLGLYIGIALVVYHFTVKVLGIILFALEILLLIAIPLGREFAAWYGLRRRIARSRRSLVTAGAVAMCAAVAFVPWSGSVTLPAVAGRADQYPVFSRAPALITALHAAEGQTVAAGQLIAELDSPEIRRNIAEAETRLALVEVRLDRLAGDVQTRDDLLVLQGERESLRAKLAGLRDEMKALQVRAPAAGLVLQTGTDLHVGRWVNTTELLFLIGSATSFEASAYLAEADWRRVGAGATGVFVPDEPGADTVPVVLSAVASQGATAIAEPQLASLFGGAIAVEPDRQDNLVPREAVYRAKLTVAGLPDRWRTEMRGVVHIDGHAESFASRFVRKALGVLIREAGV